MRRPTQLRTADVLAIVEMTPEPIRMADLAKALGFPSRSLSGHLTHLQRQGLIRRVARGYWQRTEAA